MLTIGEIQKGILLLQPGARQVRLQGWLDGLVDGFAERILGLDEAVRCGSTA